MARIGKVKVFTQEGVLIREGHARETDFDNPMVFKYFSMGEIIKAIIAVIIFCFLAGGIWVGLQNHMSTQDKDFGNFLTTFSEFKTEDANFHRLIFTKFDQKDTRLNCLAENLKGCCPAAQSC